MGQGRRFQYGVGATIGLGGLALIYQQVFTPIFDMADSNGPFTHVLTSAHNVVPILIVVLLLAVWIWMVVAPVQQERNRTQVGRP